jgi:hypothetical protein
MNVMVEQDLVKSIMEKSSLAECSITELQQLASQYPYFGPAQLLLAKKALDENDPEADKYLQRAILHFSEPLWFDHQLYNTGIDENNLQPGALASTNNYTTEAKYAAPATEEIASFSSFATEPVIEPAAAIEEMEIPATAIETATTTEEVVDQTQPTSEDIPSSENEPLAEMASKEPLMAMPVYKPEPFDPSKAAFTFEPYHTVDYFASQGIRFRDEEKPKDKFGVQLRSFTEWLKTMKKIPATEISATSKVEEHKVEQLAEKSINNAEVLTEAMAEVWEKQGDHAKATEVYRKLSLLNPGKSAYFAAKIEQLKHS